MTDEAFFVVDGKAVRQKMVTRCHRRECHTSHHHATEYGTKDSYKLYEDQVGVIEVTDGVIVGRKTL